jgi:hypothetical protein
MSPCWHETDQSAGLTMSVHRGVERTLREQLSTSELTQLGHYSCDRVSELGQPIRVETRNFT